MISPVEALQNGPKSKARQPNWRRGWEAFAIENFGINGLVGLYNNDLRGVNGALRRIGCEDRLTQRDLMQINAEIDRNLAHPGQSQREALSNFQEFLNGSAPLERIE